MTTVAPIFARRTEAAQVECEDLVKAAENLYKHLHGGFTGEGVHRTPINGDTTRLPFATGLTPLERRLAWAQHFLAKNLPGSQQLRHIMGHRQWGARIAFGDCIFMTLSPNEQHSALVLRLSRFRRNDPYIKHATDMTQKLASAVYPDLEEGTSQDEAHAELPEYDLRKAATAKDPLAVIEAYKTEIYHRLAIILGIRMCPRCHWT